VKKSELIWFDGQLVPWDACNVHILTHTLHYGLGVFEGMRAYTRADGRSAIFRLTDHLHRFMSGARMCHLPLPYSEEQIAAACVEVCVANKLRECYLRPIAIVGDGAMGVGAMDNPTHVAIAAWPWGTYLGEEAIARGVRVKVSSFVRPHVNSQLHKGKVVGHYVNSILAKREALMDGYQEAILLSSDGYVSEATGENIFCVYAGDLWTTALGGPILGGITRHTLVKLAHEAGIKVKESSLTRDILYTADEVFMCGTAAEITPVREIDRRQIGAGQPGPITKALQQRYFEVVRGRDTNHLDWLTFYDVPGV
jgi:branched-chain amino acid aminotransferase